jgi:hypothetical protein
MLAASHDGGHGTPHGPHAASSDRKSLTPMTPSSLMSPGQGGHPVFLEPGVGGKPMVAAGSAFRKSVLDQGAGQSQGAEHAWGKQRSRRAENRDRVAEIGRIPSRTDTTSKTVPREPIGVSSTPLSSASRSVPTSAGIAIGLSTCIRYQAVPGAAGVPPLKAVRTPLTTLREPTGEIDWPMSYAVLEAARGSFRQHFCA